MSKKTEILLFSDFHAHNFAYGARRRRHFDDNVGGLYNARLLDCVQVLRDIEAYAEKQNIRTLLFGGDLFHKRQVVFTDVLFLIFTEMVRLSKKFEIIMIPGNHDYGDRAGHTHSLTPFSSIDNVTVIDKTEKVELDEFDLFTLPYTDDPDIAKSSLQTLGELADYDTEKPKILLAHVGMQGAKVGSDYVLVSPADVSVPDVPYDKFTCCFFGHFHQHQKIFPNGYFIGATHQHNWSDEGTKRGFLHLSLEGKDYTFKQIETSAPKFCNIPAEELHNTIVRPQDFVRVFHTGPAFLDKSEVSKILGAGAVELIEQPSAESEPLELSADGLDAQKLVEAWAEAHKPKDPRYLELGKQLLAEAQDKVL